MNMFRVLTTLIASMAFLPAAWADTSCDASAVTWHSGQIPAEVKAEAEKDAAILSKQRGYEVPAKLFVLAADLNNNGIDEILVRQDYDAGNRGADAVIYEKSEGEVKPIYHDTVNLSENPVTILAGMTNGHHDLCIVNYLSGDAPGVAVTYKFNGKLYKPSK